MELQDYLDVVRRHWWLLILPLVATVATVVATLARPTAYTSTATVAALAVNGGGPSGQYSGPAGAKSFVANFEAALLSPPVVNEVADTTGTSRSAIKDGLTSAPVGDSTVMEVTYTTSKRAQAARVATAASEATMRFLFAPQMDLARGPVSEAEAKLAAVDAELVDFRAKAGTLVPERDYEILANQISSLQSQQLQASAKGDSPTANNLGVQVAAKQQQLTRLAATLSAYATLQVKRSAAVDGVNAARQMLLQAKAQFAAGDPSRTVTAGSTKKASPWLGALKGGVIALVAGLFFAAGVAFLLEIRRRLGSGRRGRPTERGHFAEPDPDGDDLGPPIVEKSATARSRGAAVRQA